MNRLFKHFSVAAGILVFLLPVICSAQTVRVDTDKGAWLTMETSGNTWKLKAGAIAVTLERDGQGFKGTAPSGAFKVTASGGKYVLTGKDGGILYTLSLKGPKANLTNSSGSAVFSAKKKENGESWKISGGVDGKVKYYPDKQRIKAKDAQNNERCRVKAQGLSLAPVVCLADSLPEEHKIILYGMITALGL